MKHRYGRELVTSVKNVKQPLRTELERALDANVEILYTGSGHYRLDFGDGKPPYICSSSPRNPGHEAKRLRSILRKRLPK